MVTSREEGLKVIEVCQIHSVKLGVAMHLRWHMGHRKLHRLLQDGVIGRLCHIRIQWAYKELDPLNWRAHEELGRWWSLAAVGPHCFDLMHWFAGDAPRTVEGRRSLINRKIYGGPHDETALVALQFSDGLTAEITTSVLFDGPSRLELYGDKGFAICDGTLGEHGKGTILVNGQALDFSPVLPFEAQIQDFADAIRENREPEVSGVAGLQVVTDIIEAAQERNL